MLKRWSVENFKGFARIDGLELAPMTVWHSSIAPQPGPVLQSIALLTQTIRRPHHRQKLVIDGMLVRLGAISDHADQNNVSLPDTQDHADLTVSFTLACEQDTGEEQELYNLYKSSLYQVSATFTAPERALHHLTLEYQFEFEATGASLARLYDENLTDKQGSTSVEGLLFVEPMHLDEHDPDLEVVIRDYPQLRHHFQRGSLYQGTLTRNPQHGRRSSTEHMYVGLDGLLPQDLVMMPQGYAGGLISSRHTAFVRSVVQVSKANEQITDFFRNKVSYLSAGRDNRNAQAVPFVPSSKLDDVGARGEFAVGVYQANQQTMIEHINPFNKRRELTSLQEALDCWLYYLDLGHRVSVKKAAGKHVTWKVSHGRRTAHTDTVIRTIEGDPDVVLPVLLMGLMAPPGGLLLIEYPELQVPEQSYTRLGDFFTMLVSCGKQCLIETGSQSLVQHLQAQQEPVATLCYAI